MINGKAHGPLTKNTLCQLHLRDFEDGETLVVEPFRAKALPVIKDLMVDRSAFDRIINKGGYISVKTGSVPDANAILVEKEASTKAFLGKEDILSLLSNYNGLALEDDDDK